MKKLILLALIAASGPSFAQQPVQLLCSYADGSNDTISLEGQNVNEMRFSDDKRTSAMVMEEWFDDTVFVNVGYRVHGNPVNNEFQARKDPRILVTSYRISRHDLSVRHVTTNDFGEMNKDTSGRCQIAPQKAI